MLELEGYLVRTAMNAEIGLREARATRPDASFSTSGCPSWTDWGFCAAFAPTTTSAACRSTIVTGDYFLDDRVSAEVQALGAN